jgi:hypothetical protein
MGWVAGQRDIEAMLADHPAVLAGCDEVAEEVRAVAQSISLAEAYETGEYASGIVVEPARPGRGARTRAVVPWSAPLEGGTGLFGPRHAPVIAQNGHPFVFETHLPPGGDGLLLLQAQSLGGVQRTLVLWQHNGMPGRHIMTRAALAVAGGSPALHFTPRDWEPSPE